MREDDALVVTKFDRLGSSLSQCLKMADFLLENKIGFITLNQAIGTTKRKDPMANQDITVTKEHKDSVRGALIFFST
ncbi:hypothetical protein FXB73_08575 [Aggregatibacter actinomycetemcomitans]|uniref:recombinase family protein n=1 Tax=Aggregatibacter actinomycetemcomitans TaxID=714 RepID=UPI0011D4A268|nr:recombinase family protein [Aggregatibacter actinomycetemcomitans]TYA46689.1 hypothetical protein FXB73_08575 [Aggregatibacter actinomycetemcomitans]